MLWSPDVTRSMTIKLAVPLLPSLVAVIVAEPALTLVTRPDAFAFATAVLLLAHITTRWLRGPPLASLRVAINCTVWPASTVAEAGLTATAPTGSEIGGPTECSQATNPIRTSSVMHQTYARPLLTGGTARLSRTNLCFNLVGRSVTSVMAFAGYTIYRVEKRLRPISLEDGPLERPASPSEPDWPVC